MLALPHPHIPLNGLARKHKVLRGNEGIRMKEFGKGQIFLLRSACTSCSTHHPPTLLLPKTNYGKKQGFLNFDGRKERILEWEKNFCSDEIGICTHYT
jgi:hypothetical protein